MKRYQYTYGFETSNSKLGVCYATYGKAILSNKDIEIMSKDLAKQSGCSWVTVNWILPATRTAPRRRRAYKGFNY